MLKVGFILTTLLHWTFRTHAYTLPFCSWKKVLLCREPYVHYLGLGNCKKRNWSSSKPKSILWPEKNSQKQLKLKRLLCMCGLYNQKGHSGLLPFQVSHGMNDSGSSIPPFVFSKVSCNHACPLKCPIFNHLR